MNVGRSQQPKGPGHMPTPGMPHSIKGLSQNVITLWLATCLPGEGQRGHTVTNRAEWGTAHPPQPFPAPAEGRGLEPEGVAAADLWCQRVFTPEAREVISSPLHSGSKRHTGGTYVVFQSSPHPTPLPETSEKQAPLE